MKYYKVKHGNKTIATFKTYKEAEDFLRFIIFLKPFDFSYHIKYKGKVIA